MNIDTPVIIKHIKTDGDNNIQVRWLEYKEIFILILEHKLVDERILFEAFQLFLKLLHVEVATSIGKNLEATVSYALVVTKDVIAKSETWIRELLWSKRFIVLHLEITVDRLSKLNQRKRSPRKHVWLRNSDRIILFVLLEAVHQIFKLHTVLIFEKRHQILNNFDEYRLLLLQDVQPWVSAELKSIDETCIFIVSHPIECLNLESCVDSSSHGLLFEMVLHHIVINSSGSGSLSKLYVRHHQMLLISVLKHIFQISLQFDPKQEASGNLLDLDDFLTSFIEINLDIVTRSVTSIQTLDENTWTIPFENSSKPININLQVE